MRFVCVISFRLKIQTLLSIILIHYNRFLYARIASINGKLVVFYIRIFDDSDAS